MRLWKSWIVTQKDLSVIRKNKYVFYSLIAMPAILGIVLPATFVFALNAELTALPHDQFMAAATQLINISATYLIVISAVLPSIIASYSFVGEKVEKSLEPLLATPTTDGELLLGKSLAAFIPCVGVTFLAAAISASIVDVWSYVRIGTVLVPTLFWILAVLVITPLACIMSVEANVIVSSRVNDIRAAQQLGGLVVLPIVGLLILVVVGAELSTVLAVLVTVVLVVADVTLFYLSKETFQREEILTKWK
ncbi:MAG: ABC transporter permease [Candidatus Bathyarchaeia archaeon]|jgi:ABC-type transport system involved in multi-copper enzyme maturation permease subunit